MGVYESNDLGKGVGGMEFELWTTALLCPSSCEVSTGDAFRVKKKKKQLLD